MTKINYIQIHIGDLIKDTYHLDCTKFGAYQRLILAYYDKYQKGLPNDMKKLASIVSMPKDVFVNDTWYALEEFFVEKDGVLIHKRCVKEIKKIKEKSRKAKESINKRWKNNKLDPIRTYNERNTDVILTNNHKPITNNQDTKVSKEEDICAFEDWWNLYNYKKGKQKSRGLYLKLIDKHSAIISGTKLYLEHRGSDPQYWKHPATFLNGRHWEDEYTTLTNGGSNGKPTFTSEKDRIINNIYKSAQSSGAGNPALPDYTGAEALRDDT